MANKVYTDLEFQQAIARYSYANNINPWLTSSIILQESSWKQYPPVSSAGAIGPMQVMPGEGTALETAVINKQLPEAAISDPTWLYDPINNIQAGTVILRNKVGDGANLASETPNDSTYAAAKGYFGNTSEGDVYAKDINGKRYTEVKQAMSDTSSTNGGAHAAPLKDGVPTRTSVSSPIDPNETPGDSGRGTQYDKLGSSVGTDASTWNFSIMNFAKFVATKTFYAYMQKTYEQTLEMSLHGFLTNFMKKFYHSVQYIPTLPNCLAIVVKPETPFMDIPSCNVIYPTLKGQINFTRNYLAEPTRLLVTSDPIRGMFQNSIGTPGIINTLVFMDYEQGTKKETVVGLNVLKSLIAKNDSDKSKKPLTNCSDFEMENGIRIQRLLGGDDFYLFMIGNPGNNSDTKKNTQLLEINKAKIKAASKTLENLAKYHLLKLRYDARPGSTTTFFNPYIVPGFPMVSIEGTHESNLNVTAYVTNVSHSISPSGSSTTISFNATHIAADPPPNCMPIIETEYESGAATVFKNMFGSAVTAISKTSGVKKAIDTFKEQKGTVSETLKTLKMLGVI